jgi:hypothetical protein
MGRDTNPDEWCAAIEELCMGAAIYFDQNLRLAAAGKRGRAFAGADKSGCHAVDIVPDECVAPLLGATARARRGESSEWECMRNGAALHIKAAPAGEGGMVMVVREARS